MTYCKHGEIGSICYLCKVLEIEKLQQRIEALEAALLGMLEADSLEASHKAIKQAEALLPGRGDE